MFDNQTVSAPNNHVLDTDHKAVTCSRVSLLRAPTLHDFAYGTTMTEAKYVSKVIFTKATPYLALTGELWGDIIEELGGNWLRYNRNAL